MSEKVLVDREQLERAASVIAWMSCRSDIKAADLKRLEQCASELSCALTAPAVQGEPVEFDYPEFHEQGMGCGLEDRGITDRYEAMRYGWDEALDRVAEIIDGIGPLYAAPPAHLDVPRCQCCGYLVTESEHRGCLRSASPHPDASVLVEALKDLLPNLDEALEDLELFGLHSDQGYRKLKDWYRKMMAATKAVDAALADATLAARVNWTRS